MAQNIHAKFFHSVWYDTMSACSGAQPSLDQEPRGLTYHHSEDGGR